MIMVNCKDFRSQWSRYRFNELDAATGLAFRQHLANCRRCQKYDQQMQAVVGCLKGLSHSGKNGLESARVEQLIEKAYQRYRTAARTRHAMAATLLAGFIGGAIFWATVSEINGGDSPYPVISHQTIYLPVAGVKNISLAIDSDRAVAGVTFTIELPDGFELDGYPGQTQLSWQGQLQAGPNRLTLPLITHMQARDGILKARIEYAGGGRELVLPLHSDAGSAG